VPAREASKTRTILITGASSGIGAALAHEFASRGYALALAARRTEKIEALIPGLRAAGAPQVECVSLDVADTDAIAPAVQLAAQKLGRLDIVIANAGVGLATPVGRGRMAEISQTIRVNLLGAIATIEAALPIMRSQGGGQIVGITSVAAARGMAGFSAYSASKAGLHRYLQSLRIETYGSNIVVTEIAPGYIDTDLNRGNPSRPFVIPLEKGAAIIAGMIERRVGLRWAPVLPWTLLVPILKLMPAALLAPRRRK